MLREGIAESLYYSWSKEFLEAGKHRLAGDTARAVTGVAVLEQGRLWRLGDFPVTANARRNATRISGLVPKLASRGNILNSNADHVAAAQLAIDCEIEEGQVALAPFDLKFSPDRPDVLGPQGWLGADQFSLVPRTTVWLSKTTALILWPGERAAADPT